MKIQWRRRARHRTHNQPHAKSSKWAKRRKMQSVSLLKTHKNVMQWSRSLCIESLVECCDIFMKNFDNEKFLIVAKHTIVCWLLAVLAFIRLFDFIFVIWCLTVPFIVFFFSIPRISSCCVKWFLGILLSSGVYSICNNDT